MHFLVKLFLRSLPMRFLLGIWLFIRAIKFAIFGQKYEWFSDICKIYRVTGIRLFEKIALISVNRVINICKSSDNNIIREWFFKSKYSRIARERCCVIDGVAGKWNIMENILVVKNYSPAEKGVIILKYGEIFESFLMHFDVDKVLEKYFLVFEMSWSGSCDPCYLMYCNKNNIVFVQTPEKKDYNFLKQLNCNIIPVSLGSGDWVDYQQFKPEKNVEKIYDVAMVSHWGKLKNHKMLFHALKKIKRPVSVLLIGFPWGGRTKDSIISDFNKILKKKKTITLNIYENLTHKELISLLSKAKVQLLLSFREGGNKAIPEGLFLGIPAIVYEHNLGGTVEKINKYTGILSSFSELNTTIEYMLDNYQKFSPSEYVNKTTGSRNSTVQLNDVIKDLCIKNQERWKK